MRVLFILAVLSLAACNNEPTFDERFEKAENTIRETAAEIDAELEKRQTNAESKAADVSNEVGAADHPAEES